MKSVKSLTIPLPSRVTEMLVILRRTACSKLNLVFMLSKKLSSSTGRRGTLRREALRGQRRKPGASFYPSIATLTSRIALRGRRSQAVAVPHALSWAQDPHSLEQS